MFNLVRWSKNACLITPRMSINFVVNLSTLSKCSVSYSSMMLDAHTYVHDIYRDIMI